MPLSAGDKLGPYEILSAIGAGGMGEVYKARDTRLDRTVAIKVLPEHIAQREDLRARFEREARAVAGLNHPNICVLHDIGNQDGTGFMVMEFMEGETLAQRIEKGPIPLDQAIKFGTQIADALDRAHRAGVTHRDVKPQNIILTRDGVKVLDFGLAKSSAKPGPTEETLTRVLTTEGTVMGTPQYMAPEQFEGKEADARGDIWAFGAVLYEMVTGQKAFKGKNYTSLVGAILSADPAPMALQPFTPSWLERLVLRCLAKEPEDRWQSMRDIVIEMRTPPHEAPAAAPSKPAPWPWAVATAVLAIVAAIALLRPNATVNQTQPITLSILPPAGTEFRAAGSIGALPIISPDGSAVVFRTRDAHLYSRRLDSLEPRLLSNRSNNVPFWSPDSTTIIYMVSLDKQLFKVRILDGAPESLTPLTSTAYSGSWSDSGTMLVSIFGTKLESMAASGGQLKPVELSGPLQDGQAFNPEFLPGGQDFLFNFLSTRDPDNGQIYLATLRDGKAVDPVLLFKNSTSAHYTPAGGGRILFVRNDNLYSRKLNRSARQLEGEAELAVQSVASMEVGINRSGDFSVARNGTIAWRQGKAAASQATEFNRSGNQIGISGLSAPYDFLVLSPDEKQLLVSQRGSSAWLLEVSQPGRTELPKGVRWFGWFAGGSKLLGLRQKTLVEMSASGAGDLRELPGKMIADSRARVSSDGKNLVFRSQDAILSLPLEGAPDNTAPTVLIDARNVPDMPSFSPDGRWLVYQSRDSGGGLYVQPCPGPGPRRQIAPEGALPMWRKDGKEILYRKGDTLMSIPVQWSATPTFGAPRELFNGLRQPAGTSDLSMPLAVSHDGSRIFSAQGVEQPESKVIHIRIGAFDRLR